MSAEQLARILKDFGVRPRPFPKGRVRGYRLEDGLEEAFRRVARLSPREREVLALLAEGCDNDSIARTLVISPETARTHIQNVLGKLGVHSRLQAAAFVRQTAVLEDLLREPGDGHGRGGRLVPLGRRASGAHRREDTPPDG